MPMTLQFDGVSFGFQPVRDSEEHLEAMMLTFTDPSNVVRAVVPFSAEGWLRFKRAVAADGAVSPIALANSLNGVKLDIPKEKR